jgi:HPt (histidine-containing phosphotransfer) domain-containing protein
VSASSFEIAEALEQAGDVALLRELIEVLLDEGAKKFALVLSAEASGDGPSLEAAAHALKGAVVVFGAKSMAATFDALERAARAGTTTECRPLVVRAESEWTALVRELEAWLSATRND